MASFINSSISASPLSYQTSLLSPPLQLNSSPSLVRFKSGWGRRFLLLRVNCISEESSGDTREDSGLKTTSTVLPSAPPSSSSDGSAILAYNWCAGLGAIGFLETSYLTYIKLTNSDAFCPVGGGGACGSVLNSEYSVVFGIPLPLIGMVAYGVVAMLGLQLSGKKLPFEIGGATGRSILLVTTSSMAVASAYLLYILRTQFAGEQCLYCLASALLSFSLFFISVKDLGSEEIQKEIILRLCIAGVVVTALSASYSTPQPISTSSAGTELPFFKTEVTTESSPLAISLAKHLRSIGAKLYGAFWCSHCLEQKEMFGREAAEILDYVECFPEGYRNGIQIAKACTEVKIEGFPTWVINGQTLANSESCRHWQLWDSLRFVDHATQSSFFFEVDKKHYETTYWGFLLFTVMRMMLIVNGAPFLLRLFQNNTFD